GTLTGLTPDQLSSFERNGFCGPFTLCEPEDAATLGRRIVEEVIPHRCSIYAHTTADVPAALYRRDRHLDSPLAYRIASSQRIVDLLPPLLGPDILLWRSDLFEQGPGNVPTKPHQDVAFDSTRATHPIIEAGEGETPVGQASHPG